MKNKFLVVYIGEIMHCPPALSLVQGLADLSYDTFLLTIGNDKESLNTAISSTDNVKVEYVGDTYDSNISLIKKLIRMFSIRKNLWNKIDELYDQNTLIWVVSEGSLKHLGNKLVNYRYILHLLELNEGVYYISGNPILKMNYKNLAQKAAVVVEAEYNRAHITKAWWNLQELPRVFPNKPYNTIKMERNAAITSSDFNADLIEKLKGKKIILYQGNISKERPLQEYAHAVGMLGNDYAFVMMINGENPYPEINYDNYYCIPFVNPPFHLEITSHAFIGVLSYTPIKNDYSILNTLYCAPNKVWEYAEFGIPMIGNDLPALKNLFLENKNGLCIEKLDRNNIVKAIVEIEKTYEDFSEASKKFFDSVDLKSRIQEIIDEA